MAYILEQPAAKNGAGTGASLRKTADTLRWALINGWRVEPQSNDRAPAFGVVAPASPSAAVRRSTVRRKHQEMFKAWSQDRHD